MITHQPGYRSFGALARAALGSADWPTSMRLEARSLATVFSKLDRELDSTWLEDRPDVQLLLARLLKCSVEDVRPPTAPRSAPERRIRLADLPFARVLDLGEEGLPPGIPEIAAEPERWSRIWWVAPSGSGRTLAGSWLRARGLARYSVAESWNAIDRPTSDAAWFVELTSARDERTADFNEAANQRARVLVAAPFRPPAAQRDAWTLIEALPVESYLTELVDWVADRLPPDGQFDPEAAVEWLERARAKHTSIDSLGSVLGFCGALDELGMRATKNLSPRELAERFIRRKLEQTHGTSDDDIGWLRKNALDVLGGMARRALSDDTEPWLSPRSLEAWIALVPEEHRTGLDVDWLRLSLSRAETPIRLLDVERAARHVPPGAFRIVRGLRNARLLRPTGDGDELAPAPRWIHGLVAERALADLVGASPFEWGEALLNRTAAADVARTLFERAMSGDSKALAAVVELEGGDSPSHAAALEMAFRVSGLALLAGADLDPDLLEALWEEQSELWLELGEDAPRPRIGHSESATSSLLDVGTWEIAALAVSEVLSGELRAKSNPLAPWTASAPPSGLKSVLSSIEGALIRGHRFDEPWTLGGYALLERLRSAIGSVRPDAPLAIELPSMVLEEVVHGVTRWELAARLDAAGRAALSFLAKRHGLPIEKLGAELWAAWMNAGFPDLGESLLAPGSTEAAELWRGLPDSLTVEVISRSSIEDLVWIAERLEERHWQTIAPARIEASRLVELCRRAPESVVRAWLGAEPALAERSALEVVWRRFPDLMARLIAANVADGRADETIRLAAAAPRDRSDVMLGALDRSGALATLSGPALDELRRWLARAIAERGPGWRDAYARLTELQR